MAIRPVAAAKCCVVGRCDAVGAPAARMCHRRWQTMLNRWCSAAKPAGSGYLTIIRRRRCRTMLCHFSACCALVGLPAVKHGQAPPALVALPVLRHLRRMREEEEFLAEIAEPAEEIINLLNQINLCETQTHHLRGNAPIINGFNHLIVSDINRRAVTTCITPHWRRGDYVGT